MREIQELIENTELHSLTTVNQGFRKSNMYSYQTAFMSVYCFHTFIWLGQANLIACL